MGFSAMTPNEPINLKEWKPPTASPQGGRLFTCGRPGRGTFGRKRVSIDDNTIDNWVHGLPQVEVVHIVSLLGQKIDHYSEFDYYPFRSSTEPGTKLTFQEWLDSRYGPRFVVHEFPTVDADPKGIPTEDLEMIKRRVLDLIGNGKTVVLMDSMGAKRTSLVRQAIGYIRLISNEAPSPKNLV